MFSKLIRIGLASTLVIYLLLRFDSTVTANPNDKDVQDSLAAHGSGTAKEIHARAASLYESAAQEVKTQLEAVTAGRGERLSGKVIGQTRQKLIQIERLGPQLEIYGEPSGADFHRRFSYLATPQWHKVVKPYAAAPSSQKFVTSVRLSVKKQTPARMKTLEKLQKLVADQKWQTAEAELNKLFDGLEVGTCFLSNQERNDIAKPFSEVRGAIDTAMRRIRSQEAAQLLGESRKQQTPDFATYTNEIRQAVAALAASGQATWDGEQVTGPQLVGRIGDRWTEVHVASLRCRGVDWALQPLLQMAGANAERISPDPTSGSLQSDYTKFSTAVIDAIIAMIRADASRVTSDGIAQVYSEYVASLAPLARQVADQKAVDAWELALSEMAAKSGDLRAGVKSYDAATRELLRWRSRVATSLAQTRSTEFQTLDKRMYDSTRSKNPYLGLFPEKPDGQLAPRLLAASPAILAGQNPQITGQLVTARDVVRVSDTSSSSIARYNARTYANVPAKFDLTSAVTSLKADLMVNDQLPALTLAAANSVRSAERGDMAAVGVGVAGHHLEAVITRFATLPQPASILVPLGALPTEDIKQPLVEQMLMRFDVKPLWVQHEHFFVDLSAGAE